MIHVVIASVKFDSRSTEQTRNSEMLSTLTEVKKFSYIFIVIYKYVLRTIIWTFVRYRDRFS